MKKTTIAKKLTVYFVFLSLGIGTFGTTISLFRDYQNYKKKIKERVNQIQETILPALGSALYNEDDDQIKQSIDGILNTKDMVYIEISRVYEKVIEKEPSFKKGKFQKLNTTTYLAYPFCCRKLSKKDRIASLAAIWFLFFTKPCPSSSNTTYSIGTPLSLMALTISSDSI